VAQDAQPVDSGQPAVPDQPADPAETTEALIVELVRFARLTGRMRAMLSRDESTTDQSTLLLLLPLLHEGPLRVTDLAELKHTDPSTVSRQAAQLVRSGLVHRQADPVDGRASRLALTPAGESACRRLLTARRDAVAGALGDWPTARVALFTELFREFNSSVEAHQLPGPMGCPGNRPVAPAATPPQENHE
jgi:DNA-binding MarR family transcriptional regulator